MKKGRELEILTSKIEKLRLKDAVVKSPEFVRDVDTGERREVDVSVRCNTDSGKEIFIAIECRDRGSVQDVRWIEELISKKQSIQADVLIAVTSSSFSKPAVIKANKRGIIIRQTSKFDPQEILAWTNATYLEIHKIIRKFKSAAFLPEMEISLLLQKPLWDYSYYLRKDDVIVSFEQLIAVIANDNLFLKVQNSIPNHNDECSFGIDANLEDIFLILPPKVELIKAKMLLYAVKKIERIPLISGYQYQDSENQEVVSQVLSYGMQGKIASELITNFDRPSGNWHLNFSHLTSDEYVLGAVELKCKNPITLSQYSIQV